MAKEASKGRAFWAAHVAAWKVSGKAREAYSVAHGIKHKTLSWWIWRLTQQAQPGPSVAPTAFVPVTVEPSVPSPSAAAPAGVSVEIRTSGRTRIRLDGADAGTIAAIVSALERR